MEHSKICSGEQISLWHKTSIAFIKESGLKLGAYFENITFISNRAWIPNLCGLQAIIIKNAIHVSYED